MDLLIAFCLGLAVCWFIVNPIATQALVRRKIKRLEAAFAVPRKPTLQEQLAALEPEIKKGEAA